MATVTEIILNGQNENKTAEEINKELAAAGFDTRVGVEKTGNAYVDVQVGSLEPVTVENGKIVGGTIDEMYTVYYDGKVWHTDKDDATLIEGPGIPSTVKKDKPMDDLDLKIRPDRANTFVIQRTRKGTYKVIYDADGAAHAVKM